MGTRVADGAPTPAAEGTDNLLTRRELLRRTALATAGLVAAPAVLAACAGSAATAERSAGHPSGEPMRNPSPKPPASAVPASATARSVFELRVGTNFDMFMSPWGADARAGLAAANAGFSMAGEPVTVAIVAPEPPPFDEAGYFAREPADVEGYQETARMRYFTDTAGTLAPIDDVWSRVKGNFTPAMVETVTHANGHVYALPIAAYAYVFFYRKSLFAARGYKPPVTWQDFLSLCARMQSDKLVPIAIGNADMWPLLSVFDTFNLRLNGVGFHRRLLAGSEKWTDARVVKVFDAWRRIVPHYQPDFLTAKWQDAAAKLVRKEAGMYFIGSFAVPEFQRTDPAINGDLGTFAFPLFGNEWDGERTIEAPASCLVMPTRSKTREAHLPAANAYLEYWSKGSTQLVLHRNKPGYVPLARDTDTSQLDGPHRMLFDLVANAGHITQSMDRDMRDGFVSDFWYSLRDFCKNPSMDVKAMLARTQTYWGDLPPYAVEPMPTTDPNWTPEPEPTPEPS